MRQDAHVKHTKAQNITDKLLNSNTTKTRNSLCALPQYSIEGTNKHLCYDYTSVQLLCYRTGKNKRGVVSLPACYTNNIQLQ